MMLLAEHLKGKSGSHDEKSHGRGGSSAGPSRESSGTEEIDTQFGGKVRALQNPSESKAVAMMKKTHADAKGDPFKAGGLRAITDGRNIWLWPAGKALHKDVANGLGLDFNKLRFNGGLLQLKSENNVKFYFSRFGDTGSFLPDGEVIESVRMLDNPDIRESILSHLTIAQCQRLARHLLWSYADGTPYPRPLREAEGCGTGAGGFKSGNTCATGDKSDRLGPLGNVGTDDPRRNVGTVRKGAITPKEAGELDQALDASGGFTYQPVDDFSPPGGFAVSPFPDAEQVFKGDVSENQIFDYLVKHKARFVDPRVNVGGWYDSKADKTYLDLSIVVDNQKEATRIGRQHGQEGIFNLDSGETIIIKSEGERRK